MNDTNDIKCKFNNRGIHLNTSTNAEKEVKGKQGLLIYI